MRIKLVLWCERPVSTGGTYIVKDFRLFSKWYHKPGLEGPNLATVVKIPLLNLAHHIKRLADTEIITSYLVYSVPL